MPDWYPGVSALSRAADYLHCSVFELLDRPDVAVWTEWASCAILAERDARNTRTVEL